jgi:hypothetical protein
VPDCAPPCCGFIHLSWHYLLPLHWPMQIN